MRFSAAAMLLMPAGAWAQPPQEVPTPASRPTETARQAPDETVPDDRATSLGASEQAGGRILSKNEAYNLGRAAEGRVGVRLGNDMSYRVTGN